MKQNLSHKAGLLVAVLCVAMIFIYAGCDNPEDPGNQLVTAAFIGLSANGSEAETTTALTLSFDRDIDGLTVYDINLGYSSSVGSLVRGDLTRTAFGLYELAVSGIRASGQIDVMVSKDGYNISPGYLDVWVYYAEPNANPLIAKWYITQEAADAEDGMWITYEFTADGRLLAAGTDAGITYTATSSTITTRAMGMTLGTASYIIEGTKLTLSNTGMSGLLPGEYYKKGEGGGDDITYTVTADGSLSTTSTILTFTFNADPGALSETDITLSGNASMGSAVLSGSGTERTLSPITVSASGTATVSISRTGIEAGTKNVQVFLENDGIQIPQGGVIIHIANQTELESIRDHIGDSQFNNGKNAYILTQDITLSETWIPIGNVVTVDYYGSPTNVQAFIGNFYGNGHTIRNLILPNSNNYIGLFGFIEDALIQDLQVELGETAISLSGVRTVGIIAAGAKNSIIRNCGVYAASGITVSGSSSYNIQVYGIAGLHDDDSTIENCFVSMNITITNTGSHISVAGIGSGTIKNSYYIGTITGTCSYIYSHGISLGSGITEMSYSTGKISNNAASSGYTSTSGIGIGGSISNSATLMESIHVNVNANYSRIQHSNSSTQNNQAVLSNNYAYAGMLLNGNSVISSDADSRQGLDRTAAQFKQQTTWEEGLGWDFDNVWEMGPASYSFPIFKWQNGLVKLPADFIVIQD